MAILLKTASVRVSSIQIIQVRVQNKGKSVWKSRYVGDISSRHKDSYIGRLCSDTGMVPGGFGHIPEYRGLPDPHPPPPPGKLLGLMGLSGKERGRPGGGTRPPLPQSKLGKGRGRRPPFSFLLSTSSFPFLLLGIGKGGPNLLGVGLRPLGRASPLGRPSPPPPFIYGGGGTP